MWHMSKQITFSVQQTNNTQELKMRVYFGKKKKKRVTVNMVIENAISISTGQSNFL